MRLTKEQLEYYRCSYDIYEGIPYDEYEKICDELIEYKSLGEILGVDLIILFKALKEGIWYKDNHDEVKQFIPDDRMHIVVDCNGSNERTNYWSLSLIDLNLKKCLIDFWVDNYGKTWALTKEELL